jgi:signal transduction histidine kinase
MAMPSLMVIDGRDTLEKLCVKVSVSSAKTFSLLGIIAALVAATSMLLAACNLPTDRFLFDQLVASLSGRAVGVAQQTTGGVGELAEGLLLCLVSILATWTGYKLSPVARAIVSLQLLVLSWFGQWVFWNFCHFGGHPVSYCWSIVLGHFFGWVIGSMSRQQRKSEAQYYELLLRNRELNETKLQLVKQDEVERRTLAGDLHDQVLNDLKTIQFKLKDFLRNPEQKTGESIDDLLNRAMSEIREVMDSLCPSTLQDLGLPAAIEESLRRGAERSGFMKKFRNEVKGKELEELSIVEQSLLYRLVQEAITNICKHAEASTVKITMEIRDQVLTIRVIDDGHGINPTELRSDSRGIRYMQQRADLIGAAIAWQRGENDRGTTVEIVMNLAGRESDKNTDS